MPENGFLSQQACLAYDEEQALCRFTDDGCPNHGESEARDPDRGTYTHKGGRPRLLRRLVALRKANRRLRRRVRENGRLARTDPLTGLSNRRAIEAVAAAEVRRRERYPGPLTLGLIDVDEFKAINSAFLVPGGDRALVGIARALERAIRRTDRVGRLGGDEFLVVAPETDAAGAASLAARIRGEIGAAAICYDGRAIRPTVSIGLAVIDADMAAEYGRMLHAAAAALRDAKEAGRDGHVIRLLTPAALS